MTEPSAAPAENLAQVANLLENAPNPGWLMQEYKANEKAIQEALRNHSKLVRLQSAVQQLFDEADKAGLGIGGGKPKAAGPVVEGPLVLEIRDALKDLR